MNNDITRIKLINLFDIYHNMFSTREKEIFKYYYEEDYSLQEISEILNITRSAIHKTLKKITEELINYEENLQIWANNEILKEVLLSDDITVIKEKIIKILNS